MSLAALSRLPRTLLKRAVRTLTADAAVVTRDDERVKQTAAAKLESLYGEADEKRADLESFSRDLRDGHCTTLTLLGGIQKRVLTMGDLVALNKEGVLSASALYRIQTQHYGGSHRLSMMEILVLFKEKLMGTNELVTLVKRGDLRKADLEELVKNEVLPKDVADVIETEIKEIEDDAQPGSSGYTGAMIHS